MREAAPVAAKLVAKQTICLDDNAVQKEIRDLVRPDQHLRVISFVNVNTIIKAREDARFFDAIMLSHRVYRDGIGVEILMRKAGREPGLNVNGTDFIPRLIAATPRERKLALLGTTAGRVAATSRRLEQAGFGEIVQCDGFKDEDHYVRLLAEERPSLVILGMGMPKQELLAERLLQDPAFTRTGMVVVNGGAIIDFMSGEIQRAPGWMRRAKVEWAYRLAREPKRLLPRFIDNTRFLLASKRLGRDVKTHLDGNRD
ncbi:WecB/TagA/CpsF family glycosyltransferase [Erythrobacteraceae bacterium WH01K]|nr:WecB/TagA/CpsF family glycosyltransferase [Erythrobacteraceae bacterium WH01K]